MIAFLFDNDYHYDILASMSKQCQILARAPQRATVYPTRTGKHADASTEPADQAVLGSSLGRHVTLTVSVKGMKTIDRIGIEAALARIRRNTPDRLELTKLDPVVRKRVTFHETR